MLMSIPQTAVMLHHKDTIYFYLVNSVDTWYAKPAAVSSMAPWDINGSDNCRENLPICDMQFIKHYMVEQNEKGMYNRQRNPPEPDAYMAWLSHHINLKATQYWLLALSDGWHSPGLRVHMAGFIRWVEYSWSMEYTWVGWSVGWYVLGL